MRPILDPPALNQPKINQIHFPRIFPTNEKIIRLYIPMHKPDPMYLLQTLHHLQHHHIEQFERNRLFLHHVFQGLAQEFHFEDRVVGVLVELEYLREVGGLQGAEFAVELVLQLEETVFAV